MISIKNVSKWYGDFQVLTDCSTEVAKGEVVVVCGPSGSGKSTLIKCVNALEPFQKGDIVVDGTSIADPKPCSDAASPTCTWPSGNGAAARPTRKASASACANASARR